MGTSPPGLFSIMIPIFLLNLRSPSSPTMQSELPGPTAPGFLEDWASPVLITQQISPTQLMRARDTGDAAVSNTQHPGSWPSSLERLTVDKYTQMFN